MKAEKIIAALRVAGYKVRVRHICSEKATTDERSLYNWTTHDGPVRYITDCRIFTNVAVHSTAPEPDFYDETNLVAVGISSCGPHEQPSRKVGYAKALGRAYSDWLSKAGLKTEDHPLDDLI